MTDSIIPLERRLQILFYMGIHEGRQLEAFSGKIF